MTGRWKEVFAKLKAGKKEQWLVYLLLAALLAVIVIPAPGEKEQEKEKSTSQAVQTESGQTGQAAALEAQLTAALSQVEGVGAVKAMITLESTGTKVVEKDHPESSTASQQTQEGGETQNSTSEDKDETTVYEKNSDGAQTPYVISETLPQIRGVLIVAEGGDDPVIIRQIQEAVMALFHIDVNKIKVMKMK